MRKILILFSLVFTFGCKEKVSPIPNVDKTIVVTGLDGTVYELPIFTDDKKAELEKNLDEAKIKYESNPSEENLIWVGRRLAYLYKLDEAITIFSQGLTSYPNSYKILRHRGHRYISLRKFDLAIDDLNKAAELIKGQIIELEPDGIPNKLNKPLSNYHFNIFYHLGLAHYLKGEYEEAEKAYVECMKYSDNNDLKIATADWMFMTKQRLNKSEEAIIFINTIDDNSEVIENDSYLTRIKLYKQKIKVEEVLNVSDSDQDLELKLATQGYGVANWYLQQKDTAQAKAILQKITAGSSFTAFGFIAAESDLHRMNKK